MRLKSFDNYLIASMSFFALVSLYMLYGPRFISPNSGQIKVASIVEQIKTVKRKRDFYQSWVDVNPGDSLSQNDEIYTHGQSSAKIHFENGPEINLFENSLLRIKTLNKENTLTLDKGNLSATLSKNSPKLDVVLNGKKYSFESENANIQIEQGKTENKFLLLDGKAKLNINEEAQEIKANQVVIQNISTGSLKISELPFILKTPLHNSVKYFKDSEDINFSWSYTNLTVPAKILISKNSKFTDIVSDLTISENNHTHQFKKPGIYYWKLISPDKIEGQIRTLTLIEEQPLFLSLDKEIVYKGPKKAETVLISWPSDKAKKYLLKIESPDKKTDEIKLEKNIYPLIVDQTGDYKISAKVDAPERPLAIWSEPITINVVPASEIKITSLTPESIERIFYNKETPTQLLSWNGPSSGVEYTVKLTIDNKTEVLTTTHNSIPLTMKKSGTYEWAVNAETESGILSNTISGKIKILTPKSLSQTPSEGAIIELEKPDQLVSFKWDEVKDTEAYLFELSSDEDFKTLLYEKDSKTNNISTALAKTGKYFWRVKIKSSSGIEYSNPVSVEIKPTPPLSRPEDLPSLKIKLKYNDKNQVKQQDTTTWINKVFDFFISSAHADELITSAEWDLPANSRAKEYIVEIYEDQELKKLVTRMNTERPHVLWQNAKPGTFYWRVSYVDFWGRKTEFSKASTLLVENDREAILAAELAAQAALVIELVEPKHKEDILEFNGDSYNFKWEKLPETKSYQLVIDPDLEFSNPIFSAKSKSNEYLIDCSAFKKVSGDYYWKVTTAAGNSSKRRMVHVDCSEKIIEKVVEPGPATPEIETLIESRNTHYARLGLFPHKLSYTNTSTQYSAKVDGNALNSVYAIYHRPVDWKYFQSFTPSLWVSRGKVFETITFTDLEINMKAGIHKSSFTWGPVLALIKKTLYVESNLAITSEGLSSPAAGVFIQKEIGRFSMNAEVKFGGLLNYHADINYALKNKIGLGLFFDSISVTKEPAKHSFSSMGLKVDYHFAFLDTLK